MAGRLSLGPVHHLRLTVTDVARSQEFYTQVLGFDVAMDSPPPPDDPHHEAIADTMQGGVILQNRGMMIGLRPVDAGQATDRFDPFRVGLDHVSFGVDSRTDLDDAIGALDELGVEHGEVRELPGFGLCFLAFNDPDGIQLELTAPSVT